MDSENDVRDRILSALVQTAPEIDGELIDDDMALRQQIDLDSMDWLTFLQRVHRHFQIDIPESDYSRLRTLREITGYVAQRVSTSSGQGRAPA